MSVSLATHSRMAARRQSLLQLLSYYMSKGIMAIFQFHLLPVRKLILLSRGEFPSCSLLVFVACVWAKISLLLNCVYSRALQSERANVRRICIYDEIAYKSFMIFRLVKMFWCILLWSTNQVIDNNNTPHTHTTRTIWWFSSIIKYYISRA